MTKIPVTVIIPVKNEEFNLCHCLKLLSEFDQVMIIDSNSTDGTLEVAKAFEAETYQFIWNGKFPKKRNWVLRNLNIRNDWVLFLDADEYITEEFKKELQQKISNPRINGYWVTYQNYFMNKRLKRGYPLQKLPLFRYGEGEYERIDEDYWSTLDMEVHEHPIVNGKTGRIEAPVIHKDYKNLEQYINRHNAYSTWEAYRFLSLQDKGSSGLNVRQKLKYGLLRIGLLPIIFFFGSYFLKLGFLDGKEGFYFHLYKAHYFLQIQTKLAELQGGKKLITKEGLKSLPGGHINSGRVKNPIRSV